jgi:hypothetical protein
MIKPVTVINAMVCHLAVCWLWNVVKHEVDSGDGIGQSHDPGIVSCSSTFHLHWMLGAPSATVGAGIAVAQVVQSPVVEVPDPT